MNETSAREATLLQAFETTRPSPASWSEDDRRWVDRLARQEVESGRETPYRTPHEAAKRVAHSAPHGAADPTAAEDTEAYLASRARHAMQRLVPREPQVARVLAVRLWRSRRAAALALIAFALGLLADTLGSTQRINLLAPPLWGVVAWNVAIYFVLIGHALARLLRREPPRGGAIARLAQRLAGAGGLLDVAADRNSGNALALQTFAALWASRSAPLAAARGALVLHLAAAALALGLVAGLYARGLVLDYRAAWQSTFLSADVAHALLVAALGPAAAISGIALPDAAGLVALRAVHGDAVAGASAAPWIHLLALTLLLFVIAPRAGLAAWSGWRALRLARHFVLPNDDAYLQALRRRRHGAAAHVQVLPYAQTPTPQATQGLHAMLAAALGDDAQTQVLSTVPFGTEDDWLTGPDLPASTTHAIALFDLAATPEAEAHGRFMQHLVQRVPGGAATLALVDASAFAARFAGEPVRIAQRREAWCDLAARSSMRIAIVDLIAGDTAAAARDLQQAVAP
jgi:Protein of unknown function (DUF2868)